MAIEKEKLFEIINEISNHKDLNKDNLLEKIKDQLSKKKYEEEYNKFRLDCNKNHQFSISTENLDKKEDWTLLHIAAACNNQLIVKLLLNKKVSINTRVKDGSDNGATALHIAASHGYQEIIQLLLNAKANPLLKNSKDETPRDMVGNVQDRDTIIKILEAKEENYLMESKSKAKDLSTKVTEGRHHLSQGSHGTMAKTVKTSTNVINPCLEQHDTTQETSIANENVENEQYSRISVKDMVKELESSKKENNVIRQSRETEQQFVDSQDHIEQEYLHDQHLEQHKASLDLTTDGGSSNDSGVDTPSEEEINLENVNAQDENALHRAAEGGHKHLIKGGADINVQNENGKELKQQIQESENQNTKLTETYKISLEKKQKEIEELKNCNESLKQEIKSLKSQRLFNSELNKTKISEVPLERAGLCFFKAASINFVTTLAILSIASNLPILSIIAASVMSALVAGGITYAISEPATKFQEVDVSKATGKEVIS